MEPVVQQPLINQEENVHDPVTRWKYLFLFSGIIIHLVDVGFDIRLACNYLSEGKMWFFSLTIIFVFAPAIVNMLISFRMDKQNKKSVDNEKPTALIWKRKAWFKVPVFLLLSAPVFYSSSILRYAYKSRNSRNIKEGEEEEDGEQKYYKKMLYECEEYAILRIFDAFLEAAPQQTLQLTILLSNPDKTASPSWLQIGGLCSSFCSMAWTTYSYHSDNRLAQKDKFNITTLGMIFQLLWHFFITVSRIIAISVLASQWPIYTIFACFLHWLCMTLWLIDEPVGIVGFCGSLDRGAGEPLTRNGKIRSRLFAAALGFVYIFTHINPGENKTFLRHLIYYSICGIENLVAVIIWLTISDQSVKSCWHFQLLITLTILTLILGIVFMIIYYEYFHPNSYFALYLCDIIVSVILHHVQLL